MAKERNLVIGIIGAFLIAAFVFGGGAGDLFSLGDDEPDTGIETVATEGNNVDMDVELPSTVSSADVYLFDGDVDLATSSPVHYGDYVDFDSTEAVSGLTEGEDYEKVSISSGSTATFSTPADQIGSGDAVVVVEDKSSPREYHYRFADTEIPAEVALYKVEQSINLDLDVADFQKFPTYKSDNVVTEDPAGEITTLSADIDDPSSNVTDRERTVTRTIEYENGLDYAGTLKVTSFNPGDGVSAVDVTVTDGGEAVYEKTLESGSVSELSDDNEFSQAIVDSPASAPEVVGGPLKVTFDVTYDANTAVSDAGDGEIGPGESMFTFEMTDIYGNSMGTAGTTSITG